MPAPLALRANASIYAAGFIITHSQIQIMSLALCTDNNIAMCHGNHYHALIVHIREMSASLLRVDYWADPLPPITPDTRYLFIIDFIPGPRDGPPPETGWPASMRDEWWTKFGHIEAVRDAEIHLMPYVLIGARASRPVFFTVALHSDDRLRV